MTGYVHPIVRAPDGNDFGIDLLGQHHVQADHHARAPG